MRLGLRAVGLVEAGAVGVGTTADAQGQAQDGIQRGDGAEVIVISPQGVAAGRAVGGDGGEGLRMRRAGAPSGTGHGGTSSRSFLPLFYAESPAKFAFLEKKGYEG